MSPKLQVSIIIPTYNEASNLPLLVKTLEAMFSDRDIKGEIVVVDDASPDGTGEVAEELSHRYGNIRVIHRPGKMGLGSAIITGFKEALEKSEPEALVQMDADFSHPPEAIPSMLETLAEGNDVAVASRYCEGGEIVGWGFLRRLVSLGANKYARYVLGLGIRDVTTGFKAYRSEAASYLVKSRIRSMSFAYQAESLYRLRKAGFKIVEVPFAFKDRKLGKSKLGIREIVSFMQAVLMMRLSG